jgi:hypothetical protein
MRDRWRLWLKREHGVERRDAVCVSGRDCEALADVIQRSWSDPAALCLDGMEDGQKQMSLGTCQVAPARGMLVGLAADPAFR